MRNPIVFLWISGLALAFLEAGCESDSDNPDPSTSSSGTTSTGGSGGNIGGAGGAGGDMGGNGGAAGGCGGGAGGGEACFSCITELENGACQEVYATCLGIIGCQGWLDCVESCANEDNSVDCYKACDQQFLGSNSANQNLKSCACTNCATVCGGLCPCEG